MPKSPDHHWDIQKEMTLLCSQNSNSILRWSLFEDIKQFSWEKISDELQQVTPTLYAVLRGCTNVKRRVRSIQHHEKEISRNKVILRVCTSILLHHKKMHMNALQHIISLVLNAGHSGKQVTMPFIYSHFVQWSSKIHLCLTKLWFSCVYLLIQ